jgi:antitoxin component YwqK of YwqJK toxin-antitoxin module
MLNSKFNIIFGIALFVLPACKNEKSHINLKTMKEVPANYVNAANWDFKNIADTIYYKNKPFTGIQFSLYPSGDTAFIKPYSAGLQEGISKNWYPNQQLADERLYISGKKEGLHKGYWPNGKLKFSYQFDNDEFNGLMQEWYSNGQKFKAFNMVKGYEVGSQKLWWINGQTKANYMIKNGRRYGLLGTKNCINVADSVFISR